MKTTKVNWVSVNKQGYPSKEEYGHYPTVLVSMKMVSETTRVPFWRRLEKAELRYFGGDPSRPYWCNPNNQQPIENTAWVVTHWVPWLRDPQEDTKELTDESKA